MTEVSVIVPVFNEVNAIETTLLQLDEILKQEQYTYEILVVNDGSTDETWSKIKGTKLSHLIYIEHEHNKGYGAAIKSGVRKARYKNMLITDADGTYPIHEIPRLVKDLEEYDMVVGQRSFKSLPIKTKPAKWFINKIANYIAETRIPDLNSGLRAFRKKSLSLFCYYPQWVFADNNNYVRDADRRIRCKIYPY
jgi:glycosyltransferase involved in cell wall biosynthesis